MTKITEDMLVDAYKAGFREAAQWASPCTQDADSPAVDDAAREYVRRAEKDEALTDLAKQAQELRMGYPGEDGEA